MSVAAHRTAAALAALGALAALVLGAGPARAADPAEALFQRGVDGMTAGRYDEACPLLEQSYRRGPRPVRLFALAECEATRGRIAAAVRRYDEYLALHEALSPPARQQQGNRASWARSQQAALAPHVPKLVVALPPGAPADAVVTLDGAALAASAVGAPIPVDPGEHVLITRAPGGRPTELHVRLARDERRRVELEVAPPSPGFDLPPAPTPTAPTSGRRTAAYVTGGVGLAGVLAGAVLGGLAAGEKGTVDTSCGLGGVPGACNHAGKTAADRLQAWGLGSTVGLSIGAAAVATAVVLVVTEPRGAAVAGAGGVQVALGPTGRGGFSLGVLGAW